MCFEQWARWQERYLPNVCIDDRLIPRHIRSISLFLTGIVPRIPSIAQNRPQPDAINSRVLNLYCPVPSVETPLDLHLGYSHHKTRCHTGREILSPS